MRIFLYEFVTGGGWRAIDAGRLPPASLATEGEAMLSALVADFLALVDFLSLDGAKVTTLRDAGLPLADASPLTGPRCHLTRVNSVNDEREEFSRLAHEADWTVVIAPESDGCLESRARRVLEVGGRLLGPSPQIIALAADKQRFAEHLALHSVPAPRGCVVFPDEAPPTDISYPAIWKLRDGCGSQGIRRAQSPSDAPRDRAVPYRVEPFCPGVAASVAFLCGPNERRALAPCRQNLSDEGTFQYLGGELPLTPELADRATRLATRAIATLDDAIGYLGVDLVLGPDVDGADDVIMELNPRLTTSYVGLRAAATVNPALAMLGVARGHKTKLDFRPGRIQFTSDGAVHSDHPPRLFRN